ncbi:MAG: aminopeptidase P family protein [Prevotella sp.]|nr:aminopeptidase P family protein [Prevotella sp.]
MNEITQRLNNFRELMRREHLAAFIFPSTDPHQGEYVPDHWKGREFISGFNGSAGTAVVTADAAALWTDSRYFIAAEEQLKGTGFQLMKLKMAGTPTIPQWIGTQLSAGSGSTEVGIDGACWSAAEVQQLVSDLRKEGGLTLRTNLDPLRQIWTDRPPIPERKVEIQPLKYAGESARQKIGRVRQALRQRHADGMLMTALDDIAWTLNLRGSDVHCNPVFVSYLIITTQRVTLYINNVKLTSEVVDYLHAEGVEIANYADVAKGLRDYFEYSILLDPNEVNHTLYEVARQKDPRVVIIAEESPVKRMKTIKNPTEIAGFRSAMLKDGIALVKFLKWLSDTLQQAKTTGNTALLPTEMDIDRHLTALRAEQSLYRDISFDTIAGYGSHAAIVHYEATPESDVRLEPHGLLLIDSGAQYLDGTTDVTRTIALGTLTDEERLIYTLVLKGHIQIELCKFPEGCSGTQLDVLARKDMWREGFNYLHGTGHGVGSYLNVHEGPHQLRMEWKPAPLVAGMTITDEPGIYLAGRCGVRTENTLLITPYRKTEFGTFLQFEALTLCPIDKTPILPERLTPEETDWLDSYHRCVYETLAPHLTPDEVAWLAEACAPLKKQDT